MIRTIAAAALLAGFAMSAPQAAEFDVKMLNQGPGGMFVFEPALVRIQPGDTVHFIAKDKGHNVESVPGMLPDGAAAFSTPFNQDLKVTFDKPGVYGFRCKPHEAMGMVGMVVVGDPVNEAAARSVTHPGKSNQVFGKLFNQLDAQKTAAK